MKNIIVLVALCITLLLANTAGAQTAGEDQFVAHPALQNIPEEIPEMVPVIMGIPTDELFTEPVLSKVADRLTEVIRLNQNSTPAFRDLYWEARSMVFGRLWNHNLYDKVRTLLISKVKNYLHKEGNLSAVCLLYGKGVVLERLRALSPDERGRVALLLISAQQTFVKMKDPATAETFKRIEEMRLKVNRRILRENLPDEVIAQAILDGEDVGYWDFDEFRNQELSNFPDVTLAEFAWRRHCEGGDELVDEYLKVINTVLGDLLSIKDKD
ncbi:MAG: hypothetical protein RL150_184 [Candidatus Parcubacteria bacterium]|jgi:hypothetical protein